MSGIADGNQVGKAGEAIVAARLLQLGFDIARPEPDRGIDLLVVARDMTRVVPIQVKTLSGARIGFQRGWFSPIDVVLVVVWLHDAGQDLFVFDGVADVERFLGASAATDSWQRRGIWTITDMSSGQQRDRLGPFRDAWAAVHRRLGDAPPAGPVAGHRLTRHARERVDAGEVREDWIAEALAMPDRSSGDPDRKSVV